MRFAIIDASPPSCSFSQRQPCRLLLRNSPRLSPRLVRSLPYPPCRSHAVTAGCGSGIRVPGCHRQPSFDLHSHINLFSDSRSPKHYLDVERASRLSSPSGRRLCQRGAALPNELRLTRTGVCRLPSAVCVPSAASSGIIVTRVPLKSRPPHHYHPHPHSDATLPTTLLRQTATTAQILELVVGAGPRDTAARQPSKVSSLVQANPNPHPIPHARGSLLNVGLSTHSRSLYKFFSLWHLGLTVAHRLDHHPRRHHGRRHAHLQIRSRNL